jgi:hypothetical protein
MPAIEVSRVTAPGELTLTPLSIVEEVPMTAVADKAILGRGKKVRHFEDLHVGERWTCPAPTHSEALFYRPLHRVPRIEQRAVAPAFNPLRFAILRKFSGRDELPLLPTARRTWCRDALQEGSPDSAR